MASRDPSATPDGDRRRSGSATNSPGKDGLDRVELSDLDSSPPQLPVEQDLMQLARLGELRGIQKLFDSGRYNARSTDDQGITALHVRRMWKQMGSMDRILMYTFHSGLLSMAIMRCVTFSSNLEPMSMRKEEMLRLHPSFGPARDAIFRSFNCSSRMVPIP